MEMTEMNFIHMHKTVVREVISTTTITKSINMMKLNSVVRCPTAVEPESDSLEVPVAQTSGTSVRSQPKKKTAPGQ